jgi:hypothetical protein
LLRGGALRASQAQSPQKRRAARHDGVFHGVSLWLWRGTAGSVIVTRKRHRATPRCQRWRGAFSSQVVSLGDSENATKHYFTACLPRLCVVDIR